MRRRRREARAQRAGAAEELPNACKIGHKKEQAPQGYGGDRSRRQTFPFLRAQQEQAKTPAAGCRRRWARWTPVSTTRQHREGARASRETPHHAVAKGDQASRSPQGRRPRGNRLGRGAGPKQAARAAGGIGEAAAQRERAASRSGREAARGGRGSEEQPRPRASGLIVAMPASIQPPCVEAAAARPRRGPRLKRQPGQEISGQERPPCPRRPAARAGTRRGVPPRNGGTIIGDGHRRPLATTHARPCGGARRACMSRPRAAAFPPAGSPHSGRRAAGPRTPPRRVSQRMGGAGGGAWLTQPTLSPSGSSRKPSRG